MSNRTLRVNELIQRELSDILRKKYQTEATAITISSVVISPDLHEGKVYVAVMGDGDEAQKKLRWLRAKASELRFELGRRIVLKWLPKLTYDLDDTTARGNRILNLLDEIDAKERKPSSETKPEAT